MFALQRMLLLRYCSRILNSYKTFDGIRKCVFFCVDILQQQPCCCCCCCRLCSCYYGWFYSILQSFNIPHIFLFVRNVCMFVCLCVYVCVCVCVWVSGLPFGLFWNCLSEIKWFGQLAIFWLFLMLIKIVYFKAFF